MANTLTVNEPDIAPANENNRQSTFSVASPDDAGTHEGDDTSLLLQLLRSNLVFSTGLLQQNMVSYQQSMNELSVAILAKCAARIMDAQGDNGTLADDINTAIQQLNKAAEDMAAMNGKMIVQANELVFEAKNALKKVSA